MREAGSWGRENGQAGGELRQDAIATVQQDNPTVLPINLGAIAQAGPHEIADLSGHLDAAEPSPYDSGESRRSQGISKAGNSLVRHVMIQSAWMWLMHQPQSALSQWFRQRTEGHSKRMRWRASGQLGIRFDPRSIKPVLDHNADALYGG